MSMRCDLGKEEKDGGRGWQAVPSFTAKAPN